MSKQLLIAGVDPGTTLGYAVIGINKRLIKIGSSKQLDLSSLIKIIAGIGNILIVGTDKKRIPDFVEKFSRKIGARVIPPKNDLKIKEKKAITAEYEIKNSHEMDALASALFAYKEILPLLKKIDSYLKIKKKERFSNEVKELLLTEEGLNIKSALDIAELPEKEEVKTIKKAVKEKKLTEKDFFRLYDKLKRKEKSAFLLKKQNIKLKQRLKDAKQKYFYLEKKMNHLVSDEKAEQLIEQKEKRLFSLYKQIKTKESDIENLNKDINKLRDFISILGDNTLLKKLRNLGKEEFKKKNRIINIQDKDILLVDDPNITSKKVIEFLKNKIEVIIFKKKVSKKVAEQLSFIFLDYKKLKIKEDKYFAVVDKKQFEKEKNNVDLVAKIVEDYKRERWG